jgi:hypothetical protein
MISFCQQSFVYLMTIRSGTIDHLNRPFPTSRIGRKRDASWRHGRRLNDRGCGLSMGKEFVKDPIQVRDLLQQDLEDEAVFSGYTMALRDFGDSLRASSATLLR